MSQNTEYTVDPSRLVSPDAAPADAAEEVSLRPKTLDDYIGQQHLVGKGKVLRVSLIHI